MVDLCKEMQAEQQNVPSPFVFVNPYTGNPYRRDADTAWQTALKNAKLPDVHFHDLRHTAASWLVMKGADLIAMKEILGHHDLKTTQRYAHLSPGYLRTALRKLGEVFGEKRTE